MTLQLADIVILAIFALSVWKGLRNGLVSEALSLVGWVFGLLLAVNGYVVLAPALAPYVATPSLQMAAAFLLLLMGAVLVVHLAGLLVQSLLKALALGPLDKLAGAAFGAARGLLIALIGIAVLSPLASHDAWWREAALVQQLQPYVPLLDTLRDQVRKEAGRLPQVRIQPPKHS